MGPLSLNLVRFFSLYLCPMQGDRGIGSSLLCPGTPLVFSYLEEAQRFRLEVDVRNLQRGHY